MRAYLSKTVQEFHAADPKRLLQETTSSAAGYDIQDTQVRAWKAQIEILKASIPIEFPGRILFEFQIPRMGRRVDVCLVTADSIFVLEFKVGANTYNSADKDQTIDYALDLKNFHETSHDKAIVPILIATNAAPRSNSIEFYEDGVSHLCFANSENLEEVIAQFGPFSQTANPASLCDWENGRYKPTPTIIEAAKAMYAKHSIEEISRSEAGAQNLSVTNDYVQGVVKDAKTNGKKAICFVTGVPGSGKTLAGLNIATQAMEASDKKTGAVFLSGNVPLVNVLQEALARDQVAQAAANGTSMRIGKARDETRAFIQKIHHWRDEYIKKDKTAPEERLVVFDEAQRAWTVEQTSDFMRRKKGLSDFNKSEPEFLLGVMERHVGWCVVICLVGGGQEIYKGEAGIDEWLRAATNSKKNWAIHVSDKLSARDTFGGAPKLSSDNSLTPALHLSTSIRSFRAEALSDFVASMLEGEVETARKLIQRLENYPIDITRDLAEARRWVKARARGTEQFGLVASSNARRLIPEGLTPKAKISPTDWFLNDKQDVRSCYALEEFATEFEVQGLELDWVGMCWDANLVRQNDGWLIREFKGTKWMSVNQDDRRKYALNSYRVLLTRARQGMVIFIPEGSREDETRKPEWYDQTYDYLRSCIG